MVTDPIADFIIRLKNAGAVGKETVCIPFSQFKFAIAKKLEQEGFIKSVSKKGRKVRKNIEAELVYKENGKPKINDIKRVSRPGRRSYESAKTIKPVKYGMGALILSTPKGILTDKEARREKVGGEALFKIW